ncbi:unnamed protein product [Linum tenue]|uniref:Transposase n=1 Tax=Linum tenue TaxID=586396 RepID=A0AAV0MCW5_9ROSI|nr:unnamed protein product [Linum tenue]
MASWQRVVYALTVEDMDTTLDNFRRSWGVQYRRLWGYMAANWLPVRHMWAKCYTNQVRHLGNTSSNRVEGAHSSFKKWLQSSIGAVDTVFKKNDDYIEAKHLQIRKLLGDSRQKKLLRADGKPFRELNTKVTLEALRLMSFEVAVENHSRWTLWISSYITSSYWGPKELATNETRCCRGA